MKPIASILTSPCNTKYVLNTAATKNPTSITPNSIAVLACIPTIIDYKYYSFTDMNVLEFVGT